MTEINEYIEKNHKKTDIRFDTLIECLVWLIKQLKTWKGTPARISVIERKIEEVKQELEMIDPALERAMNPSITIKMNGHHKFGGIENV